ncbi:MAG: carbon starvation protein A [Candidatus Omnitrophica bacterium]|nr:carbon starvation protein A [Candidatus Omnitrophota bacterium]
MLLLIFLSVLALFYAAYHFYGEGVLSKLFGVDDKNPTPSHTQSDGIDYVPTPNLILFGHHFSSIAGAGPIVGPIIVGVAFGWLPALIWIVLGSILIGGPHDMGAVLASVRHQGRSLSEIARRYISPLSYKLFLLFIWLALVYILIVFADLTSASFVEDGATATASFFYILLAVLFGLAINRFGLNIFRSSLIFVPLIFAGIYIGIVFPVKNVPLILGSANGFFNFVLLVYVFFASTLPVWFLLQPRDYLSSYLLYFSVLAGVAGILLGEFKIAYPAFTSYQSDYLGPLFPLVFVTIACGAVSGFHALVGSGTTSKQINRESDAVKIGYGGMLVEGIVAVIALMTVMILAPSGELGSKAPLAVYAEGIARFLAVFHLPVAFGKTFGLMALSAFILTTLDTATRLGRYVFQEFFGWTDSRHRWKATAVTLIFPAIGLYSTLQDPLSGKVLPAWKVIWPLFGTTNQLLAGLVLLVISVYLLKSRKKISYTLIPCVFMVVMSVWSLAELILKYGGTMIGGIAIAILILTVVIIVDSAVTIKKYYQNPFCDEKKLVKSGIAG